MQTSGLPTRMPIPFADSGTKNTIPQTSQIGVTAGLASFPTGFPPLTMTPVAAGGVPPYGADFNGILNAITQSLRWSNAGMGYPFDAAFAASVNGYPKGALVPNSTFNGFWLNTGEANSVSPEAADSTLTGWVPVMAHGATAVTLTGSSVTLTSLQAARDRIVLSGALTANVTLYLPAWLKRWVVTNNCTGAFSVTISTTAGSGVVLPIGTTADLFGDGANISLLGPRLGVAATSGSHLLIASQAQSGAMCYAVDTGSASAYAAVYAPAITSLTAGMVLRFMAGNSNTGAATFSPNSMAAAPIYATSLVALQGGEIAAGGLVTVQWNASIGTGVWVLLDSAGGGVDATQADAEAGTNNTKRMSPLRVAQAIAKLGATAAPLSAANLKIAYTGTSASALITADEVVLKDSTGKPYIATAASATLNTATVGANGLDTGTLAASGKYFVWLIWNGSTLASLCSLSATAPTLPSGYTYKARVGAFFTDATANKYPLSGVQFGKKFRYVVGAGNVASLPTMASGAAGSVTTPTYVAVATGAFIPTTASFIQVRLGTTAQNCTAMCAPSASYTTAADAAMFMNAGSSVSLTASSITTDFALESANLYWASNNAGCNLRCVGWEDNL